MLETTNAERLRAAFLSASKREWPDLAWTDVDGTTLVYPEQSPGLGKLGITFSSDEMTLWFGTTHEHHTIYDPMPEIELRAEENRISERVIDVIKSVIADEIVVRSGWLVTRVRHNSPSNLLAHFWRLATPWVHEAVWSGRRPY